jgi:orotidine-5'-phosphate decarboxylase
MLEAAAAVPGRPALLGVTVLTSLDAADLVEIGIAAELADQALRVARLATAAGLEGLVCSPLEIAVLRQALGPGPKIAVPGIRPAAAGDDQKRVMAPARALALGANLLVIGRPITRAPVPAEAAADIARGLRSAA